MNRVAWRETINSPAFALAELSTVVASGAVLCLVPQIGFWAIAASLIPWSIRAFAGLVPFRRSSLDWLIVLFLLTAATGLWASYDQTAALEKFMLIVMSVVLFYALGAQPQENLVWVSVGLFCVGVYISVYFFLTHDFIANPRKLETVNAIGRWVMDNRPSIGWQAIHPNYVSGIAAITTPHIVYAGWAINKSATKKTIPFLLMAFGLGVVLFALLMATSRGVLLAIVCATGIVLGGVIFRANGIRFKFQRDAVFPFVVLVYLVLVVVVLFAGPAQVGGGVSEQYHFGDGSRAELFARSAYLISDFPLTGGGLGAFPGLYSHYLLGIPHYNVPNSHNLFLDVFIEQGVIGGVSFLLLYLAALWRVSRLAISTSSFEMNLFGWAALGTLIIAFVHGMVDDYLYHEKGTILSLVLVGISVAFSRASSRPGRPPFANSSWKKISYILGIFFILLCLLNINWIRSLWRSNIGAVRMAQVELERFPTGAWAELELAVKLDSVEKTFLASLEADPANRTANHRLGLIAMLRRDFSSAVGFLEIAHLQAPGHRGVVKLLGYAYVWNGDLNRAQPFLADMPESINELDSYIWYWASQNLPELSSYAAAMKSKLGALPVQP